MGKDSGPVRIQERYKRTVSEYNGSMKADRAQAAAARSCSDRNAHS